MKPYLIIPIAYLLNSCAVFTPHPTSNYNKNYVTGKILEETKPYVVDMGEEKLLIDPHFRRVEGTIREANVSTPYLPVAYRYENGKLIQVKVINK